ncbi:MAG: hypothetical protein R3C12_15060 [Planctomycetaceae bacterium]|nr:hypothetical protein [Planctomycetaceae bacterium]
MKVKVPRPVDEVQDLKSGGDEGNVGVWSETPFTRDSELGVQQVYSPYTFPAGTVERTSLSLDFTRKCTKRISVRRIPGQRRPKDFLESRGDGDGLCMSGRDDNLFAKVWYWLY